MAENKTAVELYDEKGLKQFIFGDTMKSFLSQINLPEKDAQTLFNREASYAIQLILMQSETTSKAVAAKKFFLETLASNPRSFVYAIANVASSGLTLDPTMKLAYLIPKGGKISFMPSYMGKKEIAYKSGIVKKIHEELVYSNDTFVYETGFEQTLIHKINHFANRGKLLGVYAVAKLQNNEFLSCVMNIDEVEKAKKAGNSGGSFWENWNEDMTKKTAVHKLFKSIPKMPVFEAEEDDNELNTNMEQPTKTISFEQPKQIETKQPAQPVIEMKIETEADCFPEPK